MIDPDLQASFEEVEANLRRETDWKTSKPAMLVAHEDHMPDPIVLQALFVWLEDRGWRITADADGGLWVYARSPLDYPGDVKRNLN